MRVIIAGSRSFNHYLTACVVANHYLHSVANPVICCGHAQGADHLGLRYARENGLPVKSFIPQWRQYGRAAGVIRNYTMAEYAQALILFWDGQSKGSKSMLTAAKKQGLDIRVFYFNTLFNELGQPFQPVTNHHLNPTQLS